MAEPVRSEQGLAPHAEVWERETRAAFLGAYWQTMGRAGHDESPKGTVDLLSLFELEKALYELRYELDNRPDWVGIPLAGILGLIPR